MAEHIPPKREKPHTGWSPVQGSDAAISQPLQNLPNTSDGTKPSPDYNRLRVVAYGPGGSAITATGQIARTLCALVDGGTTGVTALEVGTWAYRFAAYVHTLRRKHGLVVETQREAHGGGWHGRYVLHSAVTMEMAQ